MVPLNCPSCHRQVAEAATVCIKCGADLRPSKVLWLLTAGSIAVALTAATIEVRREISGFTGQQRIAASPAPER